jgi:hypothetical protein
MRRLNGSLKETKVRSQPREEKRRPARTRCLIHAAAIGILLPIVALSAPVEMRSAEDVKTLAGTWHASTLTGGTHPRFLSMTLVIHEDSSYTLTGSVSAEGVIKAEGKYIKCGPFNLWVYDRRKGRVLQGNGRGLEVAFQRRR